MRLLDNLQMKALKSARRDRQDGVPSAFVVVEDQLPERERTLELQDWIHRDLQLAFLAPPPKLQALELNAFMAHPDDFNATLKQLTLQTRGWYEAPLQLDALHREAVHQRLGF